MGYKIIVNEYSNLQGLNSTKVLVQEYAAIRTKTTKVIVVEDTNIGSSAYNEAKAAAVTATNAANQATATLANAVVKSNPISDVAQGTAVNSLTRKDYVDSLGKGKITTRITLPSGSPATGYIPVIFEGIGSSADIYISTAGGQGSLPMNNCSFNGIVRASGWGDGVSYCTGMFTIYQTNERAIHSVHGPSESTNAAVFYVETRAFPITVAAASGVRVLASATNLPYGTSVFAVNGQEGVGNTKTMTLANFNSGTGIYKGSSIVQNQDETDSRYLLKSGDTMTGQLVVAQSGNSSIPINTTTSNDSQLQFQNQGKLRWLIQKDAVAESGSNVGSDLNLFGYNDDGTFGGSVLKVRRSTRQVEFNTSPIMNVAQSTAANSLTRRDFVEAQDSLKVSKSGDTMTDNLVFGVSGKGILLTNASIGTGNGLFVGTGDGDGASDVKTNIQIKSWYGVGIAPSGTNPDSINNIWFNARNGDIVTKGGLVTYGKTGAAVTIKAPSAQSNFILGQTGSTDTDTWTSSWFVGRGGASEDLSLYSYTHGTYLRLESDRITFNKSAYVGTAKVLVSTDEYIWKNRGQQSDLGLASAVLPGYFSFNPGASSSPDVAQYGHGFAVNPGSNGAIGVWSSQFAVTHGTPNKLWHRTGINGAAQGNWKKIYTSDDKPTAAELGVVATSNVVGTVSQISGVPTGAIIERGTFTGGEYVKYADGTMMQWGRLSISNKAVTSAAGVLFQSAAIDTVTYGPAFVGNPSPSALFLYSSGGARPWPVLTSSTATYASFVLQCGMSVSAMAGDYVWQVIGRWF
ncbi:tail fiber protein [Aeromonas caviae]